MLQNPASNGIEVADSNAVYYYHFDALGSVVALSDSSGDTVQTYEYSVYGQVAVEDINHPNPYMFAGRRFDVEIGLYYNRARYYNPFTGRFLQTDPIGCGAGMNMYAYCRNNSLNYRDPSGLDPCDLFESVGNVISDGVEFVVGAAADAVNGVADIVGDVLTAGVNAVSDTVQFIAEDVESHQEVAFYVIGPNGIRIPVKVFESRNDDSGIPFLAGGAINIGGEIHIGQDLADSLIKSQKVRDAQGIDLVALGLPITYNRSTPGSYYGATQYEGKMAHEIGHQHDADELGLLYPVIGIVATQDPNSEFERSAGLLGEYYGIDWNYTP